MRIKLFILTLTEFSIERMALDIDICIIGMLDEIVYGDTTPSVTDDTDFGLVDISSGTTDHTFVILTYGGDTFTLTDDPTVKIEGTYLT